MNIPEGYKLVPVEPTVAMEDAAAPECGGYCPRCDTDMQIKTGMQVDIYRTMLDSAPTPPQPIYEEAKERKLFEAFQVDEGGNIDFEDGYYDNVFVQSAWDGWKQCAQSRAKAVEVGHE